MRLDEVKHDPVWDCLVGRCALCTLQKEVIRLVDCLTRIEKLSTHPSLDPIRAIVEEAKAGYTVRD